MTNMYMRSITGVLLLLLLSTGCTTSNEAPAATEFDSDEISMFMGSFYESLAAGDSSAVASMLAEDVLIAEGGNVQTRLEYLSGHFHGDAAFLGAMERESLSFSARLSGETATVVSTSRLSGMRGEREIDMISVETAVLVRIGDSWQISSIHWSSGRR